MEEIKFTQILPRQQMCEKFSSVLTFPLVYLMNLSGTLPEWSIDPQLLAERWRKDQQWWAEEGASQGAPLTNMWYQAALTLYFKPTRTFTSYIYLYIEIFPTFYWNKVCTLCPNNIKKQDSTFRFDSQPQNLPPKLRCYNIKRTQKLCKRCCNWHLFVSV